MNTSPQRALAVVSTAVFLSSSVWFSGTAAAPALAEAWGLTAGQGTYLTIAVQLGFVLGTIGYSFLNVSDVFHPRRVFCASALLGALFNAGFALVPGHLVSAVILRFLTGVTLAGVYPVGMKIVASWFRTGLGGRLGILVGALALGTALPYLLEATGADLHWRVPVLLASAAAVAGGLLILMGVGDGPYLRIRAPFDARVIARVFRHRPFRYTAFGYFGHMWELYALWSLAVYLVAEGLPEAGPSRLSLVAFFLVAAGAFGCAAGGIVSGRLGERRVALLSLVVSGSFCLGAGFLPFLPPFLFVTALMVWGVFVVSDSPQFSALAVRHCPPEYTGTALTIQNGIGFAITIVSIRVLPEIAELTGWPFAFLVLAPGPAFGALFMLRLGNIEARS